MIRFLFLKKKKNHSSYHVENRLEGHREMYRDSQEAATSCVA